MSARSSCPDGDRILLSNRGRRKAVSPALQRRSPLWTIAGGVVGSTILFWVMVQLGQASPNAKGKLSPSQPNPTAARPAVQPVAGAGSEEPDAAAGGQSDGSSSMAAQGPALDVPREVIEMLDLRKRDLDRREEAVRQNEERLMMVRAEIEKLLAKNEALEKRMQNTWAKDEQQTAGVKTALAKAVLEKERLAQEQKTQLAKMYETMPSEDAAARLERMPDRTAIQILRLVKTKTAGAILAQVKPERAAKLTEQLLTPTP